VIAAFRIVRPRYAEDAFSGEGSRRNGGRWNSLGRLMVYTSSSVPLATLELLVTVPRRSRLRNYRLIECAFPNTIVEELDRSLLPDHWNAYPAPTALQELGDRWLIRESSVVLAVPSAVVPAETNYLINPQHPNFSAVDIRHAEPFKLDLRLLT
jgi:RES domain-containing protein